MTDFEIWVSRDEIKTPVTSMTDEYIQNVINHLEKNHEEKLAIYHGIDKDKFFVTPPEPSPWINVMYNELQRRSLSRAPKTFDPNKIARRERERCAIVCDKVAELLTDSIEKHTARGLADQIRALPDLNEISLPSHSDLDE